jgi:amylosucrase
MGHALIAGFGGIPLVYMGDEIAALNDYGYLADADHAHDSRWVHRPRMDWGRAAERHGADTPAGRVFRGVQHILARRKDTPALHAGHPNEVVETGIGGLFAHVRRAPAQTLAGLYNFTDGWLRLSEVRLRGLGVTKFYDALSDAPVQLHGGHAVLPPHARVWLT